MNPKIVYSTPYQTTTMFRYWIILTAILLLGCVKTTKPSVLAPSAESASPPALETTPELIHGVEILWRIPDTEVDGFVLAYGYAPDKLTNRIVLEKDKLKNIQHTSWGQVYRFLLKPVEPDSNIYFTLETFKGDQISPPSPVEKVKTSSSYRK